MQNTTNYKFSQIVFVRFLFTDQRGGKKRPARWSSTVTYAMMPGLALY